MLDRYILDSDTLVSLDGLVKVVQIIFYLVAGAVAILTFRSAKRGLLNSVNTEYQKRVMDRLKDLADELAAEFDPGSPAYWVRQRSVEQIVGEINKTFAAHRKRILDDGKSFGGGFSQTAEMRRISDLMRRIKSDPFIPKRIRAIVASLLEKRFNAIITIYREEFDDYRTLLAQGKHISADALENNFGWVHNKIIDRMYKEGVGVSQVEDAVREVQMAIQAYLESFDPLRGRGVSISVKERQANRAASR